MITIDNVVEHVGTISNGIIDWENMLLMINNTYITSKNIPSDALNNQIISNLVISNINRSV